MNGLEGQKVARELFLAAGVARIAIYGPASGLRGGTFELWALNERVFNF